MGNTAGSTTSEIWLRVANIIVTAIIGIGVAIFLNHREEQLRLDLADRDKQLQKELIALKAEKEIQAGFAQLELGRAYWYYPNCAGVEVRNSGPAIARNIIADIYVYSIDELWKPWIDDTSKFEIKSYPPLVDIAIEYRNSDLPYDCQELSGPNNTVRLTLDSFCLETSGPGSHARLPAAWEPPLLDFPDKN